jgi:iron complex outermembrane recepter protein
MIYPQLSMLTFFRIASVGTYAMLGVASAQQTLPEVRIQASPLVASPLESTQAVSVLRGAALDTATRATIGASLDGQTPGVHSSGFSPGASRPIIRGLDGPRVKITENGADSMDVSAISPDHTVATNPLSASAIEVLRGPATLIYGGSAIGGLVNVVTNQIPLRAINGTVFKANLEGSLPNSPTQRSSSFQGLGGKEGFNFSLGGFQRSQADYKTPLGIQANSYASADGASLGGSYVNQRMLLGFGVNSSNSQYGTVAEPDVYLVQKQTKYSLIGELIAPLEWLESVSFKHARLQYQHQEIERPSQSVGTEFKQNGSDTSLQLVHNAIGGVRGLIGLSSLTKQLNVSGSEAYLPGGQTKQNALYYVAEKTIGGARTEFGARSESVSVTPDATTALPQKKFSLSSAALGVNLPVTANMAFISRLSHNERAPVTEELFAQGAHVATRTYEIGNATLRKEISTNVELGLALKDDTRKLQITAFRNRFKNYIYGRLQDANQDGVIDQVSTSLGNFNSLAYSQTDAVFYGAEIEAEWRPKASGITVRSFFDIARGRLLAQADGVVPRLAPSRLGLSVDLKNSTLLGEAWSGYIQVIRAQQVARIATLETPTAGYTLVNAEAAYLIGSTKQGATVYIQARNLLNQVIRQHTSFNKDIAPAPGRNILLGIRAQF